MNANLVSHAVQMGDSEAIAPIADPTDNNARMRRSVSAKIKGDSVAGGAEGRADFIRCVTVMN